MCCTQELGSYAQGQGHNQVKGQIVPKIVLHINYLSNFNETSQKDKGKWVCVSRTRFRFLCPRSWSQTGQGSKLYLSNNSKTTAANLTKLHRKIEFMRRCVPHKVPTHKVNVTIRSEAELCLKLYSHKLLKQRTRVDKGYFWPQYFRKIE